MVIEYSVETDGDGVEFYDGKSWHKMKKLAKECEEGLHPHIINIERVKWVDNDDDWDIRTSLYERRD